MKGWPFLVALAVILSGALALRALRLDLRPMHGDEAVHAVKFDELRRTGHYVYDPFEYHGPTIYYPALLTAKLSGAKEFADIHESTLRIVPVLFGVVLIALPIIWRDGMGSAATLWAALFTAISPAFVFYSRYYIQEMLLVFFSALAIGAGWKYFRSGKARWALLCGACFGAMHATKETWIIAVASMLVAILMTIAWSHWIDKRPLDWKQHIRPAVKIRALLLGAVVSILLFSAFGTNPRGPLDSVLAYTTYFNRAGETDLHKHPWGYYLQLLAWNKSGRVWWSEGLILALAVVGIAFALWKRGHGAAGIGRAHLGLARFWAFYAIVMTVIYSLIPYKTPWCLLGFEHGLIVMAGYGAATIIQRLHRARWQVPSVLILLAASAQLAQQAWSSSLEERWVFDRRNPYVYAHPNNDVVRLGERIKVLSTLHPQKNAMPIFFVGEDPWPLPWYFRQMSQIGYFAELPKAARAPIIIASPEAAERVTQALGEGYDKHYHTEAYGLRPTVVLSVFIDRALWDSFLKTRS